MRKKEFFKRMDNLGLALTYDDIRLKTGYAKLMPDQVSLETKFSRHISLKIPLVSAAMDTVTEYAMAIEMARWGGIGVIHRNLSAEEQAIHVARVKHHLNGLIEKPICVQMQDTIEQILARRESKQYSFHTFPVLDPQHQLVGILTENDFDFCADKTRFAQQIMSTQLITAPQQTTINQAYEIMCQEKKKVLPLVDTSNQLVGMYIFSDIQRIISGVSSNYNLDEMGRLRVAAAIGTGEEALQRIELLRNENVDVVVIDTAHADSRPVIETLHKLKIQYPTIDVVVGNISEAGSAKRLLDAGADGLKIGQGPGSICTTRIIAGIGCPQVTAIYHCAQITQKTDVPICADGGLRYSGDIPIALAAGASSVMMGSMLAGTTQAPGDIIHNEGRAWKSYRGMGSLGAMLAHAGSRERYKSGKEGLVPEGVEGIVPYKGELAPVLMLNLGGLRRGMGYVGAATIQELQEKAEFMRITTSGKEESHPHDIHITREAPNYRK